MKTYYIYILRNKTNNVLFIGMTNDLKRRLYEHKNKLIKGFSSKYNCSKLVYYDASNDVSSIIDLGKKIKKWRREKKISLIEKTNPEWTDLGVSFEV